MPSLAVVIPAKDEEGFLPALLASLRSQTRQPDQVIVADAQSTDRTREIAREFGAMVVDGGMPGPGRNRGATVATTDLLFFIDADAVIPSIDFLEKAVNEFERRGLDMATADVTPVDGNLWDKASHHIYNEYVRLVGRWQPHAPGFCILVRRSIHESILGFDETVTFCEDHDYARRASKQGEFGFLDSVTMGVTTRRMERDGRLMIAIKFLLAELHLLILGPIRHDLFKYRFGYTHKK